MDQLNEQSSAVNDEETGEVDTNTKESPEGYISIEEYRTLKDKYHQTAGAYHNLKKQTESKPKDDLDYSNYDEEQVSMMEKIAEKKAREMIEKDRSYELEQKEFNAFLKVNPGAYEQIEDLQRMRQQFPGMSYSKLYKFLYDEEPKKVSIATKNDRIEVTGGNDMSEVSINKSLQKLMGY